MDRVIIRILDMPLHVKGMTVKDSEGDFNIYLNASIPDERRVEAFHHELDHIKEGHFYSHEDVINLELAV